MTLAIEPLPRPVQERAAHSALAGFHPPVRAWFAASFEAPTRAQELAWPVIASGQNALILAPTGSGKTLAAFLSAIDQVMFEPVPEKMERCRILYVSPLKALAVDVERNLRAPLVGVARYAERLGHPFHLPEVAIRTGDTPSKERAQFNRRPDDILITTPESLYLMLTSNARDALRSIRTVIIDEVHAAVGTKRGTHLSLTLERLEEWIGRPLQRIGLSATVRPIDETARFLGGFCSPVGEEWKGGGEEEWKTTEEPEEDSSIPPSLHSSIPPFTPRPVTIVDAGKKKQLDLTVEVPVEDMAKLGQVIDIPSGPAQNGEVRTSIWPAIHPMILDLVRRHRSTLIFVNSRRLAERLAAALNELAGEELVKAHHGSIAREQRMEIEDALKAGKLPAMVATSSLELGIDMGAIDLVVQVEAPPSVSSAIQRTGRAGHQIGVPSKSIIIPKFRGDLLACAALTARMTGGEVEPVRYPRSPLDVLAQHIAAMVGMEEWSVDHLERVIRRAAPYTEMPRSMLDGVLDMLSGRYPSDVFSELRPRITWDRLSGTLRAREGTRRLAVTNGGTIPDRGLYGVFLMNGEDGSSSRTSRRVGELDEEMVFEAHVGETFVLGASTWRIEEITHDRVLVTPAPGMPGKMPFWHGDSAGRPLEFGRAIGALCRTLRSLEPDAGVKLLMEQHFLTEGAARNLLQYLNDQVEAAGAVPDDRTIVIERYMDEMGDWRVCILSPFGSRVHAPWATAIGAMIREHTEAEVDILWTDDGIVARFPEADEPPPIEAVIPDPDEVEDLVIGQLASGGGARQSGYVANAMFASKFREAAGRALLLPRKHPGQRAPLWQQRRRASDLLKAAAGFGNFPIILEAYRECLRDVFDMPATKELLTEIRRRSVRVVTVNTRSPSPFAASLLFNYVANFMYEGDAPLAERRAQLLTVDQNQLRELLGEVGLRELLDGDALETLELQLQHLTEERKARHADAVHDLLLRLGDLSRDEILARCVRSPEPRVSSPESEDGGRETRDSGLGTGAPGLPDAWISQLEHARRIVPLVIAGETRYIAGEDAGRYRDALGIPPPPGLPAAFLEFVRDPLGDLVSRYARTHGPFQAADVAARLGTGLGPVLTVLNQMESLGRVIQGEFRPGGQGKEWCEAGVLRTLRQRSLARLRQEVEPVEQAALGRLYVAWQSVAEPRRGAEGLIQTIEQLQGSALPASMLETQILPARVHEFNSHDLDALTASGAVVWTGCEPIGESDGRISLYLAEHLSLLVSQRHNTQHPTPNTQHPLAERILQHLAQRGASFFPQLVLACGGALQQDVLDALWDLVWAGEVTNDTLQPLRSYVNPRRKLKQATGYGRARNRVGALIPPEAAGRWSLVSSYLFGQPSPTERLTARARQLLDRYGVLTREAVQHEGIEGGFSTLYPVLKGMEEAGQIRRGYFVSGLGATQFALPGAVDRLRALREPAAEPQTVLLAATDPGNPYGAALPWPSAKDEDGRMKDEADAPNALTPPRPHAPTPQRRRPSRSAGAIVVLVDGVLAAWMGRAERHLATFLEQVPDRDVEDVAFEVAQALAAQVRPGGRRAVFVKEVDGRPAQETVMGKALVEAGFTFGPHGFMRRL